MIHIYKEGFDINMKNVEFTQAQIDRIDDVYNEVYDCIISIIGVNKEDYPFDISTIGPITEELIGMILTSKITDKVYFPYRVIERNGDTHIENYYKLEE